MSSTRAIFIVISATLLSAMQLNFSLEVPLLLVVAGIFCYVRRREEIGGWLLLYYVYLLVSLVVVPAQYFLNHQVFLPSVWRDQSLYPVFLLGTVPHLLLLVLQLVFAERLRRRRKLPRPEEELVSRDLQYLQRALYAALAAGFLSFAIELFTPVTLVGGGASMLLMTFGWALYFKLSQRVMLVFVTGDWDELNLA